MKKAIMKQNKNTSAVRVVSAALAAFVLLLSLCVPSFAYTDTSTNGVDFSAQPISVVSSFTDYSVFSSLSSDVLLTYSLNSTDYKPALVSSDSDASCYVFMVGQALIYAVDDPDYSSDMRAQAFSSNGVLWGSGRYFNSTPNSFGFHSIGVTDNYYQPTSGIPVFSSTDDAYTALREWVDNPSTPGGGPGGPLNYSLPAGNVAFVDVTSISGTFDLSIYDTGMLTWQTNAVQYYGIMNTIPSSFSVPLSGTHIIPWAGTGKADFLGRYTNWSYSATFSGQASGHNHVYLCVVNPLSQMATNNADGTIGASGGNPAINIRLPSYNSIKVFSLTETFSYGTPSAETNGTTYTGQTDSSGNLYFINDDTGGIDSPSHGGGNAVNSFGGSINEWLQNIAHQIGSFFSGAIGAVTTLVSAGSDFIHQLTGLYAWLPAPVYAVLSSALILVITIGVIKVFI